MNRALLAFRFELWLNITSWNICPWALSVPRSRFAPVRASFGEDYYNSPHCLTVDRVVKKSVPFFSVGQQPQLPNGITL